MKNIYKDHIAALRRELNLLAQDPLSHTDTEFAAFLKVQPSVSEAAKAVVSANKWKEENPVSIADVAPFLRAAPGQKFPSGCLVCLEDMEGGVARDSEGRPILLCYGMPHGTSEEMKKMTAYALQRASAYCRSELGHAPGESCIIVEVMSRERRKLFAPSFRFPDGKMRGLLDFMKSNVPGSQFSQAHFCGVPSFVTSMFSLCNPFMSSELFNSIRVSPGFKHLKKERHVPTESLLPYWDKEGTFNFDLDRYVEWRCQEEGIGVDQVCSAGQGRKSKEVQNRYPPNEEMLDREHKPRRERMKVRASNKKHSADRGLLAGARWKTNLLPGALSYMGLRGMPTPYYANSIVTMTTIGEVETEKALATALSEPVGKESFFGRSFDYKKNEQKDVLTAQNTITALPFAQDDLVLDQQLNLC